MAEHTLGPWTLQQFDKHHGYEDWQTFAVRSPQNVCLAMVGEVDRFESERIPANARLIAAAPEMAAFVKYVLDSCNDGGFCDCARCHSARTLLAKVEGK